jgi:hypothetical protein
MKGQFTILGLGLLMASYAMGQGTPTIKAFSHQGNGCPANTVEYAISPGATEISLLFRSFIVQQKKGKTGGVSSIKVPVRSCESSLTLDVPSGTRARLVSSDTRGFAVLESGSKIRLLTQIFVNQLGGDNVSVLGGDLAKFAGPLSSDYVLPYVAPGGAAGAWTKCGQGVKLRIINKVFVESKGMQSDLYFTIDSADHVTSGVSFDLEYQTCT